MNNRISNKSNNLMPIQKIITSPLNNLNCSFKKILQKLNSISKYIFSNAPYLFDDTKSKNTIYSSKECYCYKNNTELKLIESRRTFL